MNESFLPVITFTDITDAALVFDALALASTFDDFNDQRDQLIQLRHAIAAEMTRLRNSSTEVTR